MLQPLPYRRRVRAARLVLGGAARPLSVLMMPARGGLCLRLFDSRRVGADERYGGRQLCSRVAIRRHPRGKLPAHRGNEHVTLADSGIAYLVVDYFGDIRRSMEAEMRAILSEAVSEPDESRWLFGALLDRFGALGGVELDIPVRSARPQAADLG